jgi:chemotaxis protein MotB
VTRGYPGPKQRRRGTDEAVNQHRWLVSYADFITLLFAFFTTLYAISNVDLQKMSRLMSALQVAFDSRGVPGVPRKTGLTADPALDPNAIALKSGLSAPPALPSAQEIPTLPLKVLAALDQGYLEASLGEVKRRLTQELAPAITEGRVTLEIDRRGLVVSIRETGSFKTGSADLPDATRALIGEVAGAFKGLPNFVRVEGHTDDVPIHTPRFASNWELSTARATAVVAFLVQEFGFSPDRLSAAGYAEFHPRVPNDSDAHRARNRRVDIVILNQTTTQAEEPAAAGKGQ